MLLNRFSNFSFLPSVSSGAASGAKGAQPLVDGGGASSDAAALKAKAPGAVAPLDDAGTRATPSAQDSVLLHLDSAAKSASAGTYTRAGVIPDLPSSLHKTPLTPAEEFVAAAVVNLRNYDQSKINAANDALAKSGLNADGSQRNAFDSIKQAVSKLYASA
jgi:hypothetical protein